jgi:hypothetical protein
VDAGANGRRGNRIGAVDRCIEADTYLESTTTAAIDGLMALLA